MNIYYVVIGSEDRIVRFCGNAPNIIYKNYLPHTVGENHNSFLDPFTFEVGLAYSPEELGLAEPYPDDFQLISGNKKLRLRKRLGVKPDNHQFMGVAREGIWQSGNHWQTSNVVREKEVFSKTNYNSQTSNAYNLKRRGILK